MSDYNQVRGFNYGLAKDTNIEAALVFEELSFWFGKGARQDKWVYKSYADMLERLPISEFQLRKAYRLLDQKGFIEIKVMKVEGAPTLHFRILRNLSFHTEEIKETMETEEIKESSIYTSTNHHSDVVKNNKDFLDNDSLTDKEMDEKFFFTLVDILGFSPSKVRLSTERRKKLAARLRSFTQGEMILAAKAIRANDYMQGKNDGNVRYGTIEYLLRKDEKVEQWLLQAPNQGLTPAEINARSAAEAKQAMADADRHIKEMSDD